MEAKIKMIKIQERILKFLDKCGGKVERPLLILALGADGQDLTFLRITGYIKYEWPVISHPRKIAEIHLTQKGKEYLND